MAPTTAQPSNGVLPAPAAILQKQPPSNTPRASGPARPKPASPRTKIVIRRLPPGLTEQEFKDILGDEWKDGGEKVDWFRYQAGKVSKDLAKPSQPSRAYLHVNDSAHLKTLSDHVLQLSFIDAKNSSRDSALFGPPSLEFAPCSKIPSSKKRNDARQATIDQDPDFIEFLQSLTNPIVKAVLSDTEGSAKKEVVKTTPLIEHLREKKAAAKEKPSAVKAAAAKHGRQEPKDSPRTDGKSPPEKQDKKIVKSIGALPEKGKKLTKSQKAAQEAVKVLNRGAAAVASSAAPPVERRRDRVVPAISVAAKIQRDLGLAPAGRRRREPASEPQTTEESSRDNTRENAAPTAASTGTPSSTVAARKEPRPPRGRRSSKTAITEKSSNEQALDTNKKVPTGPAQPTILKKPVQTQPLKAPAAARANPPQGPRAQMPLTGSVTSSPSETVLAVSPTPSPAPPPNRQAFLKHANPSQGITEVLIEEALSAFGKVEAVEIDRKKGFAYVTFGDNETLRKACAAGSVKVAQGAVQVLERRDRPGNRHMPMAPMQMQRGGFRGGRGGRSGRGGRVGMNNTVSVSPVVQAGPPAAAPVPSSPAPPPAPTPTPIVDV